MGAEKNFENKVKKFLKDEGAWFVKYWGGGEFTKAGVPDLLVCINGKFLGVEIKAKNGKPSELQLYHLQKIDNAGGYAVLLYPSDFELFRNLILCIKYDRENAKLNYNLIKKRWWTKI